MDNNTYDVYLKNFIKNYSIDDVESSTAEIAINIKKQVGGTNDINRPTGGFPPIYECSNCINQEEDITNKTDKKAREYDSHKSSVSIKTIMNKRKEIVPFISLN